VAAKEEKGLRLDDDANDDDAWIFLLMSKKEDEEDDEEDYDVLIETLADRRLSLG